MASSASVLNDELGPWMEQERLSLSSDALERLETLIGLWLRYGAVMNLTGARTRSELLPHVIDGLDTVACVAAVRPLDGETRWLDVGSGGGFPGLVIGAVADCSLWLVEPREKRTTFLELAAAAIDRRSIGIVRTRFDCSTWSQRTLDRDISGAEGGVDVVSARAVFGPADWSVWGTSVLRAGGHVVLHLSPQEQPEKFGAHGTLESSRGRIAVVGACAAG